VRHVAITQLHPDPGSPFPNPAHIEHPDGLLAWGGDLSAERLLNAYRQGIFPWYEHGSPILWWSPDPRAVFVPEHWRPSRRLRRSLRQGRFTARMDGDFEAVIDACAGHRVGQSGTGITPTWITPAMQSAYTELHRLGHAHSIEILADGQLIGGVYGIALGKVFFAESKFHRRRDASKIALAVLLSSLRQWNFRLVDCQVWNPHLASLGVELISGARFRAIVEQDVDQADLIGSWAARLSSVNLRDW